MNKKFFFTLCLLALILSFTGCANGKVQKEKELKIEKTNQEVEKQEKIKEEVEDIKKTKDIEEVTIKEPATEELPSQESYWNLNYFNLNQYLVDCGAISIVTSTENLGPDISIITADFGDFYLEISTSNYEHVANIYIGTSLPETSGFYREFDYNDNYTNIVIIVDLDDGTMVHQASIEALPDIINGIKSFSQTTPGERPQIKDCVYP